MEREVWIKVDELVIGESVDADQWELTITAPLPGGGKHSLAAAFVPMKDDRPVGGMDLVLQKPSTVGRLQLGSETTRVSLTGFTIDRALEAFTARFGHEPAGGLEGTLTAENKKHFQAEYLKARESGVPEDEAAQRAIENVSFGKRRKERGFQLRVELSDKKPREYGNPPTEYLVPNKIRVFARRP